MTEATDSDLIALLIFFILGIAFIALIIVLIIKAFWGNNNR